MFPCDPREETLLSPRPSTSNGLQITERDYTLNSSIKPESPLPFRYHKDIVLQKRIGKLWWGLRISSVFTFFDVKTDLHFPFSNCAASSQGPTAPNGILYVRDWRRTINHGSVWLSREEHLQYLASFFISQSPSFVILCKRIFYLHKEWKCEHRESNGVDKWSFSFQHWPIFVLQVYGINRDRNYTIKKNGWKQK